MVDNDQLWTSGASAVTLQNKSVFINPNTNIPTGVDFKFSADSLSSSLEIPFRFKDGMNTGATNYDTQMLLRMNEASGGLSVKTDSIIRTIYAEIYTQFGLNYQITLTGLGRTSDPSSPTYVLYANGTQLDSGSSPNGLSGSTSNTGDMKITVEIRDGSGQTMDFANFNATTMPANDQTREYTSDTGPNDRNRETTSPGYFLGSKDGTQI